MSLINLGYNGKISCTEIIATNNVATNFIVEDSIDGTKEQNWDLADMGTGVHNTIKYNNSANAVYTFPSETTTLVGRNTVDDLSNKTIVDPIDATKEQTWNLSGATSGTSTNLAFSQTANRNIVFPDNSGTIALLSDITTPVNVVSLDGVQSITGIKTFSANPVISAISNTGLLTLPTSTDTLIGKNTIDDLSNKSIVDPIDASKKQDWNISGATIGTRTTMVFNQSADRLIAFPDASDTLVGKGTIDNLSNKSIVDPIDASKKQDWNISGATIGTRTTMTFNQTADRVITFPDVSDTLIGKSTVDELSNKTIVDPINASKKLDWNISGAFINSKTTMVFNQSDDRLIVFPDASDTLVGKGTIDNLSNKSIVDPIDATKKQEWSMVGALSNTRTTMVFNQSADRLIAFPDASDTLVGRSTIDDLSNKSIIDPVDSTKKQDWDISGATIGTKTTLVFNQSVDRLVEFPNASDTLVGRSTIDDLSNKSIIDPFDASKKQDWNISGATIGTRTTMVFNQSADRLIAFPDASDTLVGKSTIDNLSNKTIVDPIDATKMHTWDLSSMAANTNMNFKFNNSVDRILNFQDAAGTVALLVNSNTRHIMVTSGCETPTGISIYLVQGTGLSNIAPGVGQLIADYAAYMFPVACTITTLLVKSLVAPGIGDRLFSIDVNGVGIGNVSFTGINTTATYTGNISVIAGDLLTISHINVGVVAASPVYATLTYVIV